MDDHAQFVDLIERAVARDPFCPACHGATDVADEGGSIVLRCAAAWSATSVVDRMWAALLPHIRVVLVRAEDLAAA